MAVGEATKEAIWLQKFMFELSFESDKPTLVWGDN